MKKFVNKITKLTRGGRWGTEGGYRQVQTLHHNRNRGWRPSPPLHPEDSPRAYRLFTHKAVMKGGGCRLCFAYGSIQENFAVLVPYVPSLPSTATPGRKRRYPPDYYFFSTYQRSAEPDTNQRVIFSSESKTRRIWYDKDGIGDTKDWSGG